MTIPLGIDRKIAHDSSAEPKKAAGYSGIWRTFISLTVKNPRIRTIYELFTGPIKNTSTVGTTSYEIFTDPTKEAPTIESMYSLSIS